MSRKNLGFTREVSVSYQGEEFLVRDNGWIYRHQRPNQRERPGDEIWTDGSPCSTSGYMKIGKLVVHRIVATAFHGEPPSPEHVVDHIDTNRRNNRAENLRWVTRLENLTENPKTLRRIEQKWGSLEGMLQDLHRVEKTDPLSNRPWMRPRAEALTLFDLADPDTESLTPLAVQRSWKTPCEFPACPQEVASEPIRDYLQRLEVGTVFSRNTYGEAKVERAELSDDGMRLYVVNNTANGVKDWAVAGVAFEDGKFVHTAHGTFFTIEGAKKMLCKLLGRPWEGGDSIDDYC